MPSFSTINTEHKSQRCQDPSSMECSTKDGQPSYKAERLEAGLQNSILSSPRVNSDEHGEITTELLPADRGDSEISETGNHDVPDQLQRMPVDPPSITDTPPLGYADTHPFFFISFRTFRAAQLTLQIVAWLKLMIPSFPMSLGCTVAGVVEGVVFLKHLTNYLLPESTYTCGYKTLILNWLCLHPRWGHLFSQTKSPFDLGGTPEADQMESTIGIPFIREVLEITLAGFFEDLTYPLSIVRDLYSLPKICSQTLQVGQSVFIVHVFAKLPSPDWYLSFLLFGVFAGVTFLKMVFAYLRPKCPLLWVIVTWITDAALIYLTCYLIVG